MASSTCPGTDWVLRFKSGDESWIRIWRYKQALEDILEVRSEVNLCTLANLTLC